ncbi:hypothetical protein J1N35_043764 [Gossypium stocksii]|uniref:Uncharacterized protein n=1 Tax=Gossypium stocksii TaxID=47602 RepID=A0A9D3U854_9ROSI|nr:hypothetical protein J1N35_043764 [Gossypium stocksii]
MRLVESTVECHLRGSWLGKVVGALSKFLSNEADGLWALRSQDVRIQGIPMGKSQNWGKLEQRLLANEMYQRVQWFKLKGNKSRGERRGNLVVKQVEKKLRQRESSKANQVSVIQKSHEGAARMGGGECHEPTCKAHDHGTIYAPWRSMD